MNIVKYPGGKDGELDILRNYFPLDFKNYYEPFVGGGSVYLNMCADSYYINDLSKDLINLYRCAASKDRYFHLTMKLINRTWQQLDIFSVQDTFMDDGFYATYIHYRDNFINENELDKKLSEYIEKERSELVKLLPPIGKADETFFINELYETLQKKFRRMKYLNSNKNRISDDDVKNNVLGCIKNAYYMYIRQLYNKTTDRTDGVRAMLYLFIRDMCYSGMFRFNSKGEFNVPYGGITYNSKNYEATIKKFNDPNLIEKLSKTKICCGDWKDFLENDQPTENDFMFVDPPYDSEFSSYDGNSFEEKEQRVLADYLINECRCRFLLDIKYSELIKKLYSPGKKCRNGEFLNVVMFDKKYSVSFMDRNDKEAAHVLIMNYGE